GRTAQGGAAPPLRVAAPQPKGAGTPRLGGSAGGRLSAMPRPAAVTTGLDVGPSAVCLLSSDMTESPRATLVWLKALTASQNASIQNISGLPQGPVHPFGGRLNWAPRRTSMSEQAIEERRGWASDIVWVVVYSILVLLVMLLWVYVPA